MKKQINKKYRILLISSAILFSTVVYFMSDSLILGASAGGGGTVSAPVTTDDSEAPTSASIPQAAQTQQESNLSSDVASEDKNNEVPKEVYVIKAGQTLWEIAQDSGLSIQTLMNKNQLSSSVIVEGQELVFD
ncbi:hypothetical protein BCR24_10445 [Enterococcus ureilyticus]|uniref:LysM domain-containing protein n=1 Tax=Enterococcus ureilyticus TaxID=1131292 RepID=A0A1E5HFM4_9ENTE|nr:LysM peptidoglycan-binding domain-containing protein [Enterococcus ureilyticus]MBM7689423.1 LysM repeat protein [Enterococcus ureilyticus]MBO0444865.1 LysM peptidoglycan-binding domain-containing protein [Enterococcus ureilyticus]OEG23723.1 hypothetical protein BCR24_10445 [Enterococcus ureilyticus]